MFAHGIPPDITGHRFDGIRWAQNIVVVAFFPEGRGKVPAKRKGSVLFEKADKFANIRKGVRAFGKEMKVIGHYAKSMKEEVVPGGALFEETQNLLSGGRMQQVRFTAFAAIGDEVASFTEIVRGGQPDVFAVVGQGEASYIMVSYITIEEKEEPT
jgi:hypothetical protein